MPSLLRALTPYEPPPPRSIHYWPRTDSPPSGPPSASLKTKERLDPNQELPLRLHRLGLRRYLGKPSKGFYRALSALGTVATPSSPAVVKIARGEMVEVTSVRSGTWKYKKLDWSGSTGLVNPTCLIKVELATEPPAYPPPPPQGLELARDGVGAISKVGNGLGFWSLLLGRRNRWSNPGPIRGSPSPTLEATARMPLETDGKVGGASGILGKARGSLFDAEVMQDWRVQVEGDGHTLGGETAIEDCESTIGDEPVVQSAGMAA